MKGELPQFDIDQKQREINNILRVIPYCQTRQEAEDLQKDIEAIEKEIEDLKEQNDNACPECGNYETEKEGEPGFDDFSCTSEYHYN